MFSVICYGRELKKPSTRKQGKRAAFLLAFFSVVASCTNLSTFKFTLQN